MNELIEQFLIESRELAGQAGEDLLTLERDPRNVESLDRVFRALHTLKGSAGIVGLPPMTALLHVGETLLAAARDGTIEIDANMIDRILECLDQVTAWMDALEKTDALPADAAARSAGLAAILQAELEGAPEQGEPAAINPKPGWVGALLKSSGAVGKPLVAILYQPLPGSFYNGDDPLAFMERIPGCVALDIAPSAPWGELSQADPYECRLVFRALSQAGLEEIAPLFRYVPDQVTLLEIAAPERSSSPGSGDLTPAVRSVLEEQRRLLAGTVEGEDFIGRIGSAARAAINALAAGGHRHAAENIRQAHALARETRDAGALADTLDAILGRTPAPEPVSPVVTQSHEPPSTLLRVDIGKVDALVGLLGELVVAKNGLAHLAVEAGRQPGIGPLAHGLQEHHLMIGRLVSEMHEAVMSIRMLPVRQVFRRFPRPVRELSASLGKTVLFVTEGDETEADKAVVESLFDPLLHLVRNAIDHGIETPARRREQGKPEASTLTLKALREGEQVIVEVRDDGKGIDPARIRQVAIARKLAPPETIEALSDEASIQLIFAPGFSTADAVSDISGRGVGMDAVRAVLAAMGGSVGVASQIGKGTTIRLQLPLTMVMTQVMIVWVGGERFGVPLDAILETTRVPRAEIRPIRSGRAFVFRDRTVPVVDLAAALGLSPPQSDEDEVSILITRQEGELVGFAAHRFGERLEVMLRPIGGLLSGMPGIAGTTLLGDGRVLLVLDLRRLTQ